MFTKPYYFQHELGNGSARCAGEAGDELMIKSETMLNMISQAQVLHIFAALLKN